MAVRYPPNASAGKYTIKRLLNTGNFAISYEAVDASGKKVFLKQYKSPSLMVSWYEAYKRHQLALKSRISKNQQLAERTYEFIDMYEHKNAFIQVYGFIEGGQDLKQYLACAFQIIRALVAGRVIDGQAQPRLCGKAQPLFYRLPRRKRVRQRYNREIVAQRRPQERSAAQRRGHSGHYLDVDAIYAFAQFQDQ